MDKISVETEFGLLVAEVGGDESFPEILVYLKNEKGLDLMVAAITDNTILGEDSDRYGLRIACYANPSAEDYTDHFVLSHAQLEADDAMWM